MIELGEDRALDFERLGHGLESENAIAGDRELLRHEEKVSRAIGSFRLEFSFLDRAAPGRLDALRQKRARGGIALVNVSRISGQSAQAGNAAANSSAARASFVAIAPPSMLVMFLLGWKLNTTRSPKLPISLPW